MTRNLDDFQQVMGEPAATLSQLVTAISHVDRHAWSSGRVDEAFDRLADEAAGANTNEALVTVVFDRLGFGPNTRRYYASDNSLIHRVLEQRRAIPLTLAIVASEVARRCGLVLTVVGMPGHALIGDGAAPDRWFDPFAGGAELDRAACQAVVAYINPSLELTDEMLRPLSNREVSTRMLANLRAAFLTEGNLSGLADTLERMVAMPEAPISAVLQHRLELAGVCRAIGRYDHAADQHRILADLVPSKAVEHRAAAARLRANRN